ncbi:hypothetical protein [Sphingomonas sp.]|uniref:hypothetical protein n=1 Tax=Sphingomonas sp. TaxID=28214 RepID=UPI0035BC6944
MTEPDVPRPDNVVALDPAAASLAGCHRRLKELADTQRAAKRFDTPWDETYWAVAATGRASVAGDGGLWFSIDRATRSGAKHPFPEPFMTFAKTMVSRYQGSKDGGHSAGGLQAMIAACRALWLRVAKRKADSAVLTNADFAATMKQVEKDINDGARNVGSRLAFIAAQIDDKGLALTRIAWKNRIKGNKKHDRIGTDADVRRKAKLPSVEVLLALSEISANATTPGHAFELRDADLVAMRAVDLLVCGGFRINELLTIPRNCLREADLLDDLGNVALDRDGKPMKTVGIRYDPEKDGEMLIKDVATPTNELARRAIGDIDRVTAPFAAVARFQRLNPGRTLLGQPWDSMPRGALLTTLELARAVGVGAKNADKRKLLVAGNMFARLTANLLIAGNAPGRGGMSLYRKSDLEAHLAGRSYIGDVHRRKEPKLLVEDCLFTVPLRFFHTLLAPSTNGTVTMLTDAQIYIWLAGQKNQPSIFERLGIKGNDGRFLSATSHQFRHWLNTLAFEGKMNDAEVARWMGRRQVGQNASYDHVTATEMARRVRERITGGGATGPLVDAASRIVDAEQRRKFVETHARNVVVTPIGLCVHDWDALPCQKHGACGDCDEHWVVKGVNVEEARRQVADEERALARSRSADDDGHYGADRWITFHKRNLARLKTIRTIHEDDRIPDGTLVQLKSDGTYAVPPTPGEGDARAA